jgi:hypothetical protein
MDYIKSTASLRSGYLRAVRAACDDISSPYALKVKRELNRNFVRPDAFDLDIRSYSSAIELVKDRQLQNLIAKYPLLPMKEDPAENCLITYNKFEEQCFRTNRDIAAGRLYDEPTVNAVIHTAKRKIAHILGDVPNPEDLSFAFGPGASYSVSGRTSVNDKLISEPDCTLAAAKDAMRLLSSTPSLWTLWGGTDKSFPKLKIVHGSRFGQVPKNAKTNRPIDIEPLLNSVLQKGYGSKIRDRLGRAGNCIRKGQDRHNRLAKEASLYKELATVDKSGASDSIATLLILELLPYPWYDALDRCRSHNHKINGNWESLEKFSAMGNGFTFELETLVFLSLARACCEVLDLPKDKVSVYGDDVIIPTDAFNLYVKVCEQCGFTINQDKTYWGQDDFRESCGADWWNGIDVRVAYMRHEPSPHYLTTLHNRMVELGTNHLFPSFIRSLQSLIPNRYASRGRISEHRYGYLWDENSRESCRAVHIVPRKRRPQQQVAWCYALYSAQHLRSIDTSEASLYLRGLSSKYLYRYLRKEVKLATEDIDNQVVKANDVWFLQRGVNMERFTRRNDFKVEFRQVA